MSSSKTAAGDSPTAAMGTHPHHHHHQSAEPITGLSETEVTVLRDLPSEVLVKVVAELKRTRERSLETILEQLAPETFNRFKLVVDSQYDSIVAGGDGDAAGDDRHNRVRIPASLSEDKEADALIQRFLSVGGGNTNSNANFILKLARSTPLRLTYEERFFLRLLGATLDVSEYTDKVDVLMRGSVASQMKQQFSRVCSILSGLVVAHHYDAGQRLVVERNFAQNAEFFRTVFELGRRYKILNPERMRDNYGKLIYFLMDTQRHDVSQLIQFSCVAPLHTVERLLKRKRCGKALLHDRLLPLATSEIVDAGKSRKEVQDEIRAKQRAIKKLVATYASDSGSRTGTGGIFSQIRNSLFGGGGGTSPSSPNGKDKRRKQRERNLRGEASDEDEESDGDDDEDDEVDEEEEEEEEDMSSEEVETVLYSLCDHNTFLRYNKEPVDKMLRYLREFFKPDNYEDGYSLAIECGREGARLTHSHARQFRFIEQSLLLWREIMRDMLSLWTLAEQDLLSPHNPYRLCDTGQGLNRLQGCPYLSRAMHQILYNVQQECGSWYGSSAIHLGDRNVPNALMFIDKYIQVPRILLPLILVLGRIPELYRGEGMKPYIDKVFGGDLALMKYILSDFFRHGFDGSGADNFYDAGSCVDGRLTSAWNWCSKIEKKRYFPIFLLCGFQGFDGRF